jgi:hypothetical protein
MSKRDELIEKAEHYKQAVAKLEPPEKEKTYLGEYTTDEPIGYIEYDPNTDVLMIAIRSNFVMLKGKKEADTLLAALKELYE